MITSIIFDFGDIFINLDKQATIDGLQKLGLSQWNRDLDELNLQFEKGQISKENFLLGFQNQIPTASIKEIENVWNAILLDFPLYRLEFLEKLAKQYKLFLLSNTDSIHIEKFEQKHGEIFCSRFYKCFQKVYFSFKMGLRKPDLEIFNFILQEHNLNAKNTLFVDDKKENTDAALSLGLCVWNLQVGKEDVVDLYKILV